MVSGINSGLNTGVDVLYSGTVAAAIEGPFDITSVAVSLEYDAHADYAHGGHRPAHHRQIIAKQGLARIYTT